jgi:hypothetical protein
MSRTENGTQPLGAVLSIRATGRNRTSRSPRRMVSHRPSGAFAEPESSTPTTASVTPGGA